MSSRNQMSEIRCQKSDCRVGFSPPIKNKISVNSVSTAAKKETAWAKAHLTSSVFCFLSSVFCLLPVFLSGCGGPSHFSSPVDYYYLNPDKDLSAIGRTTLVELDNDSSFPKISAEVTEALFQALQKKQVFGLTVLRQNDPAFWSLQLDLNTAFTLEQLSTMRRTLNCDAVLIGTVTGFKPYPHMTIGLRLKLIDLADGQLLWAIEQIWDTADKITEERIKNYYRCHNLTGSATLQEKLVTISSLKFVKFVAYETAETLQPKR